MRRFIVTIFIMLLFVCSQNGLAQWVATSGPTGLTNALASQGSNIFAGTGTGVFVSTDNGASWTLGTGITGVSTNVLSVGVSGTNIFAGTFGGGIFLSTNNGSTWTAVNTGLTGFALYVNTFAVSGSSIYAGTSNGVYLSTNSGATWTAKNTGITNFSIESILITATELFAGEGGSGYGVYLSTNSGTSWTAKNTGLTNTSVWSLVLSGSNLFAGTNGGGVFLSTNSGTSWTEKNTGLTVLNSTPNILSLAISGTYILAGFNGEGVFLSTDNGSNWTPWNTGLTINGAFFPLLISGTNVFVANAYAGVWRRPLSELIIDVTPPAAPQSLAVTDSSNKTISIKWRKNTEADFLRYRVYRGTSPSPTTKVDSTTAGVSDTAKTFAGLTNGTRYYFRVTAIDSSGNESGYSNEVNAAPADRVAPAAPQNLTVFDSTSTKVGIRWRKNADADFLRYRIYRGTSPAPTTKVDSTTGGIADTSKTFTGLVNGTRYYLTITAVDSAGNESGYSNEVNAVPADRVAPAAPQNLTVFDSTSTKVGIRWRKNADADFLRYRIYRGTSPAPTTKVDSTTGGIADTSKTFTGLTNGTRYYLRVTAVDSAGNESAYSNEVNGAPNATLEVKDLLNQIPKEYSLSQNYPNPFNPTTVISFQLPVMSFVNLRVFDLLGREVATLVDEQRSAGSYSVQWNAGEFSSGLYFYRLEVGLFSETKKLLLMK